MAWSSRSPNGRACLASGDRPIEAIQPMLIRQWQNQLPSKLSYESLMACRSILFRILQLAEDEGAITANPLRRVPPPKRRADPEQVLGQTKRRAYTPEEAGRLLASCPLFWWDHVLVLLGTGLRFGEFAGLRRSRVQLERPLPVLQVVDVRYQAGRFGKRADLDHLQLRGPHDFRHTFSTWLEDAGIPARVIDELMGHQRSRHSVLDGGSRIGSRYRHTSDEMGARVVDAIEARLQLVLRVAEEAT